jgi:hypothetical protein
MRESLRAVSAPSNRRTPEFRSEKISGIRRRSFFRTVAKHAYPDQTVPNIRVLTHQRFGESTIYDWLAGKSDAPVDVFMQLIAEILAAEKGGAGPGLQRRVANRHR